MSKAGTKVELKEDCKAFSFLLSSRCKQSMKREGGEGMLKDLTNEKLILLNVEAVDWEDAIRKAAQPLIDEHKVKPSYVDDMVLGVKRKRAVYRSYQTCCTSARQTTVRSIGKCDWDCDLENTGNLR